MSWIDLLRMSASNIKRRKLRTFLYKYYCCHCTGYDRDYNYDRNNRKSAAACLYITVCIHMHIRVIYCFSDFQLKILRSFRYISRFIFIRKSHGNLRISIRHFFAFQHGINRTGCTSFHISDENLLFFDSISFKSGFLLFVLTSFLAFRIICFFLI